MRKSVLFALLIGVLLVVFGSAGLAMAKTTINFWFPGGAGQEEHFIGAVKRFEAINPDIKVKYTVLSPNSADIMAKLNAAKLSNTFPDVFSAFLVYIGTRGAQGDFLPMDDYYAKWEGKDDLMESALAMGKYKGKLLGLGYFPAPVIPVYRKDLFKKAGLDPNKPPTNWEELEQYANKLVQRDAGGNVTVTGVDIPSSSPALVLVESFLRSAGSKVIDEEKQVPSFTDEGAIKGLAFMAKLWQQKLSVPHNFVMWMEHPFTKGYGSMGYQMNSVLAKVFREDPAFKEKVGFMPLMGPAKPTAFCGYRLFTIGAKTKYKDASWKFIKFMMTPDEFWRRYKDLSIAPVLKSLQKKFVADDPEFNQATLNAIKYGKGKAITPWTAIANKYLRVAYEEAINGAKTPKQALMDADKGLRSELKRMGHLK